MSIRGAQTPDDPLFDDVGRTYDALLVLSFGGPEAPDEVMPFLENVASGRDIPRARLEEVAEHYLHFGGVSPINAQNRALIAALEPELAAHGLALPIYFGNRNWHPFLEDTIRRMVDDGIGRALVFVTSGFSCWSGCRQYRDDVTRAMDRLGLTDDDIAFDKIRVFGNHPGFVGAMADRVAAALDAFAPEDRAAVEVVFTAHSIPRSMADASDYEAQLRDACALVAAAVGIDRHRLAYQSRSGPPQVPWLEPDILDVLDDVAASGRRNVVVAPIGFVSDHLEVLFDLDEEATEHAAARGLRMVRAGTVGTHPDFVTMVRQLVEERTTPNPVRLALGDRGPSHDICPLDCCRLGSGRPARTAGGLAKVTG